MKRIEIEEGIGWKMLMKSGKTKTYHVPRRGNMT